MAVKHHDLWERWRGSRDLEARDQLVEIYLWLIRYVAGRLMVGLPPQFTQDDVEGHGVFGLLDAVEKYDPDRNIRFETFAIPWVRGACIAGIRALQWAPAMRTRVRRLEKARDELEHQLGREATREELADYMHVSPADVDRRIAEAGCLALLSLEETLIDTDGEGTSLGDRLADPNAPDPQESSEEAERRELLAQAIDSLPDQERLVVSLVYYEGLLAREISDLLRLSDARVSQIHSRAIMRLRGKLSRLKKQLVS